MRVTYQIAMSAGRDAATARMKKAGRTKWNRADWNLSCRVFDRLYPVAQHIADNRIALQVCA